VDEVVFRRKRPVGVRDVLSIGRKKDVESSGSTHVLGVDRNHQCLRVESTVGTLEKISSKGDREPRNTLTACDILHPYGATATRIE
jgi:pSer/pThr/pTyr-binding forkhead associated (FHA) protein